VLHALRSPLEPAAPSETGESSDVSRTWAELLGDDVTETDEAERTSFFGRMRESLAKSRRALTAELASAAFDAGDDEAWERLEEALIRSDVGVPATAEIVRRLEARGLTGALEEPLVEEVQDLFGEPPMLAIDAKPSVILVVGVNGTGKTTTIGKLARKLSEHGRSVLVGAADTFRAAAEEQLEIWAERAGADFVGSPRGADPAAVAFDAVEAARARGKDVAIVDTAGRLHTQANLMSELEKIRRVIAGRIDEAPHETLLVVDATTGQNGLQQARLFGEAAGVTGVALTKLDGSARGGVAIAIAVELGLPVKLVGVGEGVDDLRPFDAADYARALIGRED
jgi:fused signal recognition particle receptor